MGPLYGPLSCIAEDTQRAPPLWTGSTDNNEGTGPPTREMPTKSSGIERRIYWYNGELFILFLGRALNGAPPASERSENWERLNDRSAFDCTPPWIASVTCQNLSFLQCTLGVCYNAQTKSNSRETRNDGLIQSVGAGFVLGLGSEFCFLNLGTYCQVVCDLPIFCIGSILDVGFYLGGCTYHAWV